MIRSSLDEIVHALLYEGYILYPYRSSSPKNQRERFTFGRVYPRSYSDYQQGAEPFQMQTECLALPLSDGATVDVTVRFLQPALREIALPTKPITKWPPSDDSRFQVVPTLHVNDQVYCTWHEAIEREVKLPRDTLAAAQHSVSFKFESSRMIEPIRDEEERIVAVLIRQTELIDGAIELRVEIPSEALRKITVRITNHSRLEASNLKSSDAVLMRTFASTHTVLRAHEGEFISLVDYRPEFKEAVTNCQNIGCWPVIVGDEQKRERDTLLSSPIILYDYPKVAPESRGDLFDSTEIDELLTLRISTMTEEEKREMRSVDQRARQLLERTEATSRGEMWEMHGKLRELRSFDEQLFGSNTRLEGVTCQDLYLARGDRVRIRPRRRADVIDLALEGRTAVIESVEQDTEQQIHLALVLDDDPGRDLGMLRQNGHRFFYRLDEVEPLRNGP